MVGWHHQLNGHGFGWTPGVGDGQGGLACCSPWDRKESDVTERLNLTEAVLAFQVLLVYAAFWYMFYAIDPEPFLTSRLRYNIESRIAIWLVS